MSKLGDVLSKEVYCNLNVSLTGVWGQSLQPPEAMDVWGQSPLAAGRFFVIFGKKKLV